MHYGSRCWKMFYLSDIIALTLPGKEEQENYAAFRRAICHRPFIFLFFSLGLFCCVCLFICFSFFFFCSPVLKVDESILCFSVWEKFRQQTFYSPPFSWEPRGAQLFLLRGETQEETRARSMFGCGWRKGRCEKINDFVLYRLAAVQKPFNIYLFSPECKHWENRFLITAWVSWQCTCGHTQEMLKWFFLLTIFDKRTVHGEKRAKGGEGIR